MTGHSQYTGIAAEQRAIEGKKQPLENMIHPGLRQIGWQPLEGQRAGQPGLSLYRTARVWLNDRGRSSMVGWVKPRQD